MSSIESLLKPYSRQHLLWLWLLRRIPFRARWLPLYNEIQARAYERARPKINKKFWNESTAGIWGDNAKGMTWKTIRNSLGFGTEQL